MTIPPNLPAVPAPRAPRSYAQLSCWERCGWAFYLIEISREWQRPDAWRPHGLALHKAGEVWERSGRTMPLDEVKAVFTDVYRAEIQAFMRITPKTPTGEPDLSWWADAGRYKAVDDIKRRERVGLGQVEQYVQYYLAHPDERPWTTPDGQPAIELELTVDLGGVAVVAKIDTVISHPQYELIVRDTRIKVPRLGTHQLCVYAVAINERYGTAIDQGDYWNADTGRPTPVRSLVGRDDDPCTTEHLSRRFAAFEDNITAGNFPPVSDPAICGSCSVNSSCKFRAA